MQRKIVVSVQPYSRLGLPTAGKFASKSGSSSGKSGSCGKSSGGGSGKSGSGKSR